MADFIPHISVVMFVSNLYLCGECPANGKKERYSQCSYEKCLLFGLMCIGMICETNATQINSLTHINHFSN